MTRRHAATKLALALVLVCLVAGCTNPLSPGETPATETTTTPMEPSPTGTTVATSTDRGDPSTSGAPTNTTLPPGVAPDGLDNASALLKAHSRVLRETGFLAVGNGTSVINRNGINVEVATSQVNRVAAGGEPYEVNRSTVAGPFQREVHAWSNGSVEYARTWEAGETNDSVVEPRSMADLTGRDLLGPYLRGAAFSVNGTEDGTEDVRVVLVATEVGNATVLQRAVPDGAEEITSYEASVTIDTRGRIHGVRATIGYVLDGREVTQELDYTLEQVGEVDVDRPSWVEENGDASVEGNDGTTVEKAEVEERAWKSKVDRCRAVRADDQLSSIRLS